MKNISREGHMWHYQSIRQARTIFTCVSPKKIIEIHMYNSFVKHNIGLNNSFVTLKLLKRSINCWSYDAGKTNRDNSYYLQYMINSNSKINLFPLAIVNVDNLIHIH